MRTILFTIAAFSLLPLSSFGQKDSGKQADSKAKSIKRSPLRLGFKAGSNTTFLSQIDPMIEASSRNITSGFYGGGLLEISGPAGSKLKGQAEALYQYHKVSRDYNHSLGSSKSVFELQQISIPILMKYFVLPQLSLNAGAAVNFNISAINTRTSNPLTGPSVSYKVNYKEINALESLQVNALIGATYYIHKGLFADVRFNPYFGSVTRSSPLMERYHKISTLQIGLGYKF